MHGPESYELRMLAAGVAYEFVYEADLRRRGRRRTDQIIVYPVFFPVLQQLLHSAAAARGQLIEIAYVLRGLRRDLRRINVSMTVDYIEFRR